MIIAEMSGNHNQDLGAAKELVAYASTCGADAIKIQMFTPDSMTLDLDKPQFMAGSPWTGKLYDLYKETAMPYDWIPTLQILAKKFNIELFPTVFDIESLQKAEFLNMPRYKIASFEINDLNLIEAVAKTNKPIIISTGTATEQEIRNAVATVRKYHDDITLLKCTSKYPAPIEELNLATIPDMSLRYGCKIGFSDHTNGIFAASVATALGADVIEKHICLDKTGLDGSFSLTPDEFCGMVEVVNCARLCLGKVSYETPKTYRRSMVVVKEIKKGEPTKGKVKSLRTTLIGTMTPEDIATQDYEIGDLIKGNKNEQSECTNNRRNGQPG